MKWKIDRGTAIESARRRSICIVHDKAEYTLIVKGVFL
jgi:hypothetical protein